MTKSYTKFKSRIRYVSLFVVLFWMTLCAKLFSIQVFQGKTHQKTLIKQSQRQENITAERGNIFDRNSNALTRNIAHYTLSINPSKPIEKELLAQVVSNITNKSKDHYIKKLNSSKSFEYLARNIRISQEDVKSLESFNGLHVSKKYRRSYPHGVVASQLLGYNDADGKGISGIEKDYNEYLLGTNGKTIKSIGWTGKFQNKSDLPSIPPIDGDDIILTIDLNYQSILQEELKKRMLETNAKSAMGVIINPQSGAILAMSSVPSFDNNFFSEYQISQHHSKVLTHQFEPGSTFKIVAATAALAENKISLTEEFNCEEGEYDYFGTTIKDHEPHGQLNPIQIIKHSSNIGIIKIAERIGSNSLYKYAKIFGFGTPTNIDIIGETSGKIKPERQWSRISLGQISMGHEVAVNALQLAVAFSAIANHGYLIKPFIIDKIYNQHEKKVENSAVVKRKIANEKIVLEIKNMLRQVVVDGTGTEADIPGWEVAGKTGTAQKYISGKYSNDHFISNFVGFLPASNPKLLSAIVLDEPATPMHWGGQGAAVAFKRIMQRIINMDDSISPPLKKTNKKQNSLIVSKKVKTENENESFPVSLSTIHIDKKTRVPDAIGMSLKKAIKIISGAGLKLKINGSGQVISQSPKPGKLIKNNEVCVLTLK